MPSRNAICHLPFAISSKTNTQRPKVKDAFTLIELLVARHPKPWRRKTTLGFTLIELLVVITIIGILATLIVASFTTAQKKSRDTKRKSDLAAVKTALELYREDYDSYPPGGPGQNFGWRTFIIGGCDTRVYDDLVGGNYIKQMPDDPQAPNYHYLYWKISDDEFELVSHLENTNDSQYVTASYIHCSAASPPFTYHYKVTEP